MSCEGPWTGFIMMVLMIVLPLGLPILGLSVHAWRRSARWSAVSALVLSAVGAIYWFLTLLNFPNDPQWLPAIFLPPLLGWSMALRAPSSRLQRLAAAAGVVPALSALAYGTYLRLTAIPCPA